MIHILTVLSIILAGFGLGKYISFSSGEGKDERGVAILARASHITISFLFVVYAVLILVITFSNISADILGLVVIISLSLLMFINGVSILYLRKKI